MPPVKAKIKDSKNTNSQLVGRSTRLLLALWGTDEQVMPKGKLTERLKRKGEKSGDYQDVFAQLEEKGAISIVSGKVAILAQGIELLGQYLKESNLVIEGTIVGAWVAKALSKWIQKAKMTTGSASTNGKLSVAKISSYESFKPEALALFEKLDKGYNYGGLVPIWHLRREFGDLVERLEFNDWVMKMQADQLFYLQSGEAIGATDEQKQDSISSEIRGLLFYASQPT
ncbi:MAG: hypothetical protein KME16_10990 [Scytolyngbya sp. HA4215-MV1]|jgi:hypothetical protein|nr:hypothetical protein [Scytolyngbya sp. HA4215-MV1]